jgi:CubicO group peptidase (beta-lactamase class C family)
MSEESTEDQKMEVTRRRFLSLAATPAATPFALQSARSQVGPPSTSTGTDLVFPGAQWEAANPAELGWSIQGLAKAYQALATLTPASMVVIDHGRFVVAWGDTAQRVKLSSVRKSLLSALYGTPVRDGRINLDDTLEKLEIDYDPPLTHGEKQATFATVLFTDMVGSKRRRRR